MNRIAKRFSAATLSPFVSASLCVLMLAGPAQAIGAKEKDVLKGLAVLGAIGAIAGQVNGAVPAPAGVQTSPARMAAPAAGTNTNAKIGYLKSAFNRLNASQRYSVHLYLESSGYYAGRDGVWGPMTADGLRKYAIETGEWDGIRDERSAARFLSGFSDYED